MKPLTHLVGLALFAFTTPAMALQATPTINELHRQVAQTKHVPASLKAQITRLIHHAAKEGTVGEVDSNRLGGWYVRFRSQGKSGRKLTGFLVSPFTREIETFSLDGKKRLSHSIEPAQKPGSGFPGSGFYAKGVWVEKLDSTIDIAGVPNDNKAYFVNDAGKRTQELDHADASSHRYKQLPDYANAAQNADAQTFTITVNGL